MDMFSVLSLLTSRRDGPHVTFQNGHFVISQPLRERSVSRPLQHGDVIDLTEDTIVSPPAQLRPFHQVQTNSVLPSQTLPRGSSIDLTASPMQPPISVDPEITILSPTNSTVSKKSRGPSEQEPPLKRVRNEKPSPVALRDNIRKSRNEPLKLLLHRPNKETPDSKFYFVLGTTGNVYKTCIGPTCSCDCPASSIQHPTPCKHILFVLLQILGVSDHDPLLQSCFSLSSEQLQQIFENAPQPINPDMMAHPILTEKYLEIMGGRKIKFKEQKPITDTECAICMTTMSENEDLVFCKYSCGNSIHKSCFDQWMKSKKSPSEVQCVYCRSKWDIEAIRKSAYMKDGYVNLSAVVDNLDHSELESSMGFLIPFLGNLFRVLPTYRHYHDDSDDSDSDSWDRSRFYRGDEESEEESEEDFGDDDYDDNIDNCLEEEDEEDDEDEKEKEDNNKNQKETGV